MPDNVPDTEKQRGLKQTVKRQNKEMCISWTVTNASKRKHEEAKGERVLIHMGRCEKASLIQDVASDS